MLEHCLSLLRLSVLSNTFAVLLFVVGVLAIFGCLETVTNGERYMNSAGPRIQSLSGDMDRTTAE